MSEAGVTSDVTGEVELEGNVLVVKRIRVVYHLATPAEDREKVDRAFEIHTEHCPVYRSIHRAIDISTELDWKPL